MTPLSPKTHRKSLSQNPNLSLSLSQNPSQSQNLSQSQSLAIRQS